ncbi:MerR family transcriptional regulator [Streptomyces sp. MUM 203J]|uniref:MerR family transcriptional regulator n=1 Tax=Streptomyces sp. MUM 203J TaxID=2791990 RepID=UPI001F03CF3C|nr:MerR family transcriptional regulator [Streptomyces sp. MUM 203J]MCH0539434.1 MerR family transcriptional regulator [Streptomyces sp. MUM 203J]
MRVGELSRRTGVSVPTIKYYVREGLLPAGQLSSPNQASYDESHVRRLKLIRALIDVGGLSVSGVREVVTAVEDPSRPVHKVLGAAHGHVVPEVKAESDADLEVAEQEVAALIARRGWVAYKDHPAYGSLTAALAALRRLGHERFAELNLDAYAQAAERVAETDLAYIAREVEREDLVEAAVVGTVVGDAVFTSLRLLAHVDASARRYGTGAG